MSFLVMRALLHIEEGARLIYDCPLGGEDYRSRIFFDQYRGREAQFMGYVEESVGPLDLKGRAPGRYLDPSGIKVIFVGEHEERELNILHFVLIRPHQQKVATMSLSDLVSQRLGDLAHAVSFYPGDLVREKASNSCRLVRDVFLKKPFTMDGMPRYDVLELDDQYVARMKAQEEERKQHPEDHHPFFFHLKGKDSWNRREEELELVSRGNVYWLYHDPSRLSFSSDKEEIDFWMQTGISRPTGGDHTLAGCIERFNAHRSDCFGGSNRLMFSHTLLKPWVAHLPRVRALMQRFYRAEIAGEVA